MNSPWRIFWLSVLTAHGTVAALWWWLMPGGFPVSSPHFWTNRIVPPLALAAVLAARLAQARKRDALAATILVTIPALWLAAAVTARVVFPISLAWLFMLPVLAASVMMLAWWKAYPAAQRRLSPALFGATLAGTFLGIYLPLSQRSTPAATLPLNPSADTSVSTNGNLEFEAIRLNTVVQLQPPDAVVSLVAGRHVLGVQPLLTFVSRSPDRCWTILAPRAERIGPARELLAIQRSDLAVAARYRDDCDSTMRVAAPSDRLLEIECRTRLPADIYSHLNSFCELTLTGHRRLFIAFSPCSDQRIEVTPGDYPIGRPHRCAYLDASGTFRVVQATSAEKGPFTELASGPLTRGQPLTMTFFDEQSALWRVTLDDFSAQASVAPSPTAGYGLPENAIEFACEGGASNSGAGVYITLAGTSVGRGYHSVGHAAGTYRNRMHVERLAE